MSSTRVETLTVLFTDLAGSTDLRVAVGEEDSDRIRRAHDDAVNRAITANAGRVAKYTGDGVMALFDGASDAVTAAVAIQQAIDALNRAGDHPPLQLRIGVSVGDVTTEGDDCFGLPVVEAQRLEASAVPGTIRCSSLVKALARGRGNHDFESLGLLELKGLEEPLAADEVRWQSRPDADLVTAPPALQAALLAPFAGREAEKAAIAERWGRAREGATEVVLLAGEPGAGKTALASQFAARVLATGGTVLAGRSDELVRVPYQPFVQVLRDLLPVGEEMAVRLAPLAAPLGLEVAADRMVVDAESERALLFDAIRVLIAGRADGPLLVVLDDLHWADEGSLLLLRHLVAGAPIPGLLVLATYRDTEIDPGHPLSAALAELRRGTTVSRVSVDALDVDAVASVAATLVGDELATAAVASAVHAATSGNAFFVCEVLRHLAQGHGLHDTGGALELPEGVRDVVGRRVALLSDDAQRMLHAASVAGTTFRLEVLARALDTPEDVLVDAIEPALDAHLVVETGVGRFGFAHALVRSTLYQGQSVTRRARLHRRVAEALEVSEPDAAAELAEHWASAGGDDGRHRAAGYAARAAEQATTALALDDAVRWYRTAVELLEGLDPVAEAEMAVRLARAAATAVSPDHRELVNLAARRAREAGAVELMAEALLVYRRTNFSYGDTVDPEHIAQLEDALDLLPEAAADLRAAVLAELALELMYVDDIDRRVDLAERVDALLPHLGDARLRAQIAQRIGVAMPMHRRSAGFFRRITDEVIAGLETERLPLVMDIDLSVYAFIMSVALGDRSRADWAAARLERIEASTQHHERCVVTGMLSMIDGRIDDAERDTRIIAEVLRDQPHGENAVRLREYMIALERDELAPLADLCVALAGASPIVAGMAVVALLGAGRVDDALMCIELHAEVLDDLRPDGALPITLGLWSLAAAGTAHAPSCERLHRMLVKDPDVHHATGGFYFGARSYSLGLLSHALGRVDEAVAWFKRSVEDHKAVGSPPFLARSLIAWAELELERGDAVAAEQLVTAALEAIGDLPLVAVRRDGARVLDSITAAQRHLAEPRP